MFHYVATNVQREVYTNFSHVPDPKTATRHVRISDDITQNGTRMTEKSLINCKHLAKAFLCIFRQLSKHMTSSTRAIETVILIHYSQFSIVNGTSFISVNSIFLKVHWSASIVSECSQNLKTPPNDIIHVKWFPFHCIFHSFFFLPVRHVEMFDLQAQTSTSHRDEQIIRRAGNIPQEYREKEQLYNNQCTSNLTQLNEKKQQQHINK